MSIGEKVYACQDAYLNKKLIKGMENLYEKDACQFIFSFTEYLKL